MNENSQAERRPSILIVDDEPTNLHLIGAHLRENFQVLAAKSGLQALQRLETSPVDLIILDILMPGMDGYETCRQIKARPEFRDIPLLFLTSLEDSNEEARGFQLGAVDYLTKPVNPTILHARVTNQLELRQSREELRRQNATLRDNLRLREEIENITRHDLKAPLNAIINLPELLLEEDNLRDDQIEMISEIQQTGYRMLEMINNSLNMLKMETGNYKVEAEEVDLLELLRRIFKEGSKSLRHNNLKIRFGIRQRSSGEPLEVLEFSPGSLPERPAAWPPVTLFTEELLVYSVLANLLKNASEASPPGSVITCTLILPTEEPSPSSQKNFILLELHNLGAVPKDIRKTFFEKYATSGKSDGTGLGTYSARLIARTLGGDLTMQTDDITGTTLSLSLPYSGAPFE
jgi:two-component system, sensor histidine kinase and response regulator